MVLGIDQGSTKTMAAISDMNGNLIGMGKSSGADYTVKGMEYAMEKVGEAITQALNQAQLRIEDILVLSAGMTGADWEHDYLLLHDALMKLTGISSIKVVNDCIIALRGGTDKKYGAVICAGTGLNSAVIDTDGNEFIFGFYIAGEHQGGSALGLKALYATFHAYSGVIEKTALTEAALNFFKASNVDNMLLKFANRKISDKAIRSFVPILFQTAYEGDSTAQRIIGDFGREIAKYAVAGLKRFGMLQMEVEIVLSGSIFKAKNPILVDAVAYEIHSHAPRAVIKNALYEPVVGAVLLGLEYTSKAVLTEQVRRNIEYSAAKSGLRRI